MEDVVKLIEALAASQPKQKVLNKCSFVAYAQVQQKLNTHMESYNTDGWELISVATENIGIEEYFICFWRKVVPA